MECGGGGGMSPGAARVKEEPGMGFTDQVNVKEEAESTDEEAECVSVGAGARGVSEAALLAALYTDHAVKDELVLGPEGVQPSPSRSDYLGPRRQMDARGDSPGPSRRGSGRDTTTSGDGSDIGDGYTTVDYEKDPICDLCGRRFALKSDLTKHAVVHINHMPAGKEHDEGSSVDQDGDLPGFLWRWARLVPRDCRVRLERCDAPQTRATFLHHVENTYVCDICKRRFTLKRNLILHIKVHSPNILQVIHKRTHRTNGPFTCECEKEFSKLRNLLAHIIWSCQVRKIYPCDICKRFFTKSGLKRHALTHTGEKPFSCEICKRNFSHLCTLRRHKAILHEGIYKSQSCEICNKLCISSSALHVHRRVHTGEKPYICGVCKQRFTQSGDLSAHKRIHTGEKPFSCEICKKRFRKLTDLYRHKRVHTGEKPHCCQTCEKKFNRLCRLTEHIRKHTGEKPFCCEICSKIFSCYDALKAHKRIHENKRGRPKKRHTPSLASCVRERDDMNMKDSNDE